MPVTIADHMHIQSVCNTHAVLAVFNPLVCLLQAQTAECLVVGEIAVNRMAVVLNKCDLVS